MINFNLSNRVAIVTGGAQGFGLAISERFVQSGAKVIIWDVDKEAAETALKKINSKNCIYQIVDVTNFEEIKKILIDVESNHGKIDIFINNAGIDDGYLLKDQTYEKYRETMKINMDAPFLCSKYALPLFEKANGGRIVMITSIQGIRGYKGSLAYNTAKGGLINMTRVLAVELAEKNILVNSVAPGFINTPMAIMKDGVFEGDTDWFKDVYLKYEKLPMKRYGQTDDIAGAVYFFCSEDSKYVTGQTLLVDGGVSITF